MTEIYDYTDNFKRYHDVKSEPVILAKIDSPKFTIQIPTYERSQTLRDTIASALNQTIKDGAPEYEIVITNNSQDEDGSTAELIRSFRSDRISYFVNSRNIGMFGNWNRGIELARGEYVVMLHDDDVLSPYYLEALTAAIRDNRQPELIGVNFCRFQETGTLKFAPLPAKLKYWRNTKTAAFLGRTIFSPCSAVRKDVYFKLGGYNEEYYPNADYIFFYKILTEGGSEINIDYPLSGYRIGENTSMKPGTMRKIILMTEHMRRNIAEHEIFARVFMKLFDKEYLYSYITGANNYWHMNIEPREILREFGMNTDIPSHLKMKVMNFIIRVLFKVSRLFRR